MSSSTSVPAPGEVPAAADADSSAGLLGRPAAALSAATTGVWWLALIAGIAWILYGMFILSLRPTTLLSLAILAGFAFIFGGISQFIIAQRVDDWRWLFYVGGVLGVIAGILAFAWPGRTLLVLSVLVAWYLVIGGIFAVIAAFAGPKRDWWWVGLVVGVLELMLGVWAIGSPGRELLLLVNLVGIYMVFFGVSEIFAAFSVRSAQRAAVA